MDDIDYEAWADFILDTARARGWQGRRVLDLGCGTGNSTFPFFARGYGVVGLDASAEMLAVARGKLPPVEFVQGNFTSFSFVQPFDLIVSVFDSLNNLLESTDFVATARCAYDHLTPGGIFMFDVNTTSGLRDLWESGRAEGWAGEVYYLWEHAFDEVTGLARVEAHCAKDGYAFTEVHFERAYDPPELRVGLEGAGFGLVEVLAYPSGLPAAEDEARVWVVAQKG